MDKKLGVSDLRKFLQNKSQPELIEEIITLFKSFPVVHDYYASKSNSKDDKAVLEKYRKIIKQEFYPDRGFPELNYSVARKAITEYQKLSNNRHHIADLMLSYVEYGIMMTNSYGDIDERFYNSMESMFEKCLKFIKQHQLEDAFYARCQKAVTDCDGIGWGFADGMADLFQEYLGGFNQKRD